MTAQQLLQEMTFEEKVLLLTGSGRMDSADAPRLGIEKKHMADGPHGVRTLIKDQLNPTAFPNLCSVGATWDVELVRQMGEGLAAECIEHGVDMLLAPGINIKRHILCGRNFEYFSEDPVLAGELGASYIASMEEQGVSTSLKHFACNNQEKERTKVNIDVDFRTLREIYLKGFEIAVKKGKPQSVMCAYNRLHSIWCSENSYLLTDILKKEWGYEGFVISDWGAVHNIGKALAAGLDMQMPGNANILEQVRSSLEKKELTMEQIDQAVLRVLPFLTRKKPEKRDYNRQTQHKLAQKIASEGIVLLKNRQDILPLSPAKYKKISVIGEFAQKPNFTGQGAAEIHPHEDCIDNPFEELKKNLGNEVELQYMELYKTSAYSEIMLWPRRTEFHDFIRDSDVVVMFIGSMVSEDSECFDRRSPYFNPNHERFIEEALRIHKKVIVVMQTGSAMILGSWKDQVDGIVEMWLAGEGAGKAIADVLTGIVNPSGKLPETFPNVMRSDLDYPGTQHIVEYKEKLDIGYRYYDKHPNEICYPFGYGLSYTTFDYRDLHLEDLNGSVRVSLEVQNTGNTDGAEIVQIYVGSRTSSVKRPIKELKAFKKVYLKSGETQKLEFMLSLEDFAYYNVLQNRWVTESGSYMVYAAASSQDIRCTKQLWLKGNEDYSVIPVGHDMIG